MASLTRTPVHADGAGSGGWLPCNIASAPPAGDTIVVIGAKGATSAFSAEPSGYGVASWTVRHDSGVRRRVTVWEGVTDGSTGNGSLRSDFGLISGTVFSVPAAAAFVSVGTGNGQSADMDAGSRTPTAGASALLLFGGRSNVNNVGAPTGGFTPVASTGQNGASGFLEVASASGSYHTDVDTGNAFSIWEAVLLLYEVAGGGGLTLTPAGLDLGLAFGTPRPLVSPRPSGLDLGLAFGSPALVVRPTASGLDLALGFGDPTVQARPLPAGLDLGLAFGSPRVVAAPRPAGLDLGLAFGDPAIAAVLHPAGLDLGLAFGTPNIATGGNLDLTPGGLDLGLSFGTPVVVVTPAPAGLDLGLAFGTPGAAVVLAPAGLDLGLTLGAPAVLIRPAPAGLDLGLAFGAPGRAIVLAPAGLDLGLAFGDPTIPSTQFPLDLCAELARVHAYVVAIATDPQFVASIRSSRC